MYSKEKIIAIIGASFYTGNLGVSALAWSAIYLVKNKWPKADISLLGGRQIHTIQFTAQGKMAELTGYPVRYCKNVLAKNHLGRIYLGILSDKLIGLRSGVDSVKPDTTLASLLSVDLFCDITGGDSFSDIYGMSRLFRGFLLKRLCQMTGKPFVLLPQTYGPFKSRLARWMARSILLRASGIYSRDQEGLEQIRRLMGSHKMKAVPKLCPDVAFVLEPRKPASISDPLITQITELKTQNSTIIGLNISGLLYNGGYIQNNQFGLACDYKSLVKSIVSYFVRQPDHYMLLVPHVIPDNMPVENDLDACKAVWELLPEDVKEKVIMVDGQYDQNEIKYIIGQCDFFLGARMHATIAALSQCIPAVGMAYSKKFSGVFETVGVEDSVVDMRTLNEQETLNRIQGLYENRTATRQTLTITIPIAQQKVLSIFQTLKE